MWAAVALVLLRVGVGWHFYKEGSEKVQSGKFSSAGFLGSAKGPLAGMYKSMLRDPDGYARLDSEETLNSWASYRARVSRHYGFDEEQETKADEITKRREEQLKFYFRENAEQMEVYFKSLETKREDLADPVRQGVASLKGQLGKKAVADYPPEPGKWFAQIEALWKAYELDLNGLANESQKKSRRPLALPRPGATAFGVDQIDKVLPYFDLLVGICLMLGLLTRPAAIAGAIFLCSVMAAQWPGAADATPVYPQLIETLALFTLAATGAGKYAGLDGLFSRLCCKRCAPAGNST